jgi:cytochrome c-type biogenesis protein CcmE
VDPQRKRQIRLVVALSVAVLLAVALIYTSFSASSEAKEPSELVHAAPGTNYLMTGEVVKGSVRRENGGEGESLRFRVVDRAGESSRDALAVTYTGTVPDPFRGGREIVLNGEVDHGVFVGERDTLVTKCPSKFTTANENS